MTYQQTITYLYDLLPVFHREGKKAYKPDLSNTIALCNYLGNPQNQFKSIHIAGTNGKGSSSHFMASVLQSAGYKVGLYTSPHLKSYTERFRINGLPIAENLIVEFVAKHKSYIETLKPSFFELSVGLAFQYFADEKVDVAVIEVGLGGRLDSTNVITPELSLITNIGYDHTDILGDTLEKIATEKAGIIKPNIPVVISERHPETENVFEKIAKNNNSLLFFAQDSIRVISAENTNNGLTCQIVWEKKPITIHSELRGKYQTNNLVGILQSILILNTKGWEIPYSAIEHGIQKVVSQTGLKGRWQELSQNPKVICDTAHNAHGFTEILECLSQESYQQLWMILGFVSDKDVAAVLRMLPQNAKFIFCQAKDSPRSMPVIDLQNLAKTLNIEGEICEDVNEAIQLATSKAAPDDFIYVGGSTFVIAEINNL